MSIRHIKGDSIPSSPLPFSPAVEVENFIFISGQASVDKDGKIINDTFENECRRSFENVRAILLACGLSFQNVVQVRNYVGREEDLIEFNQIYKEYFTEPYPARTTLIGCLGNILKFEVDVVACRKK
jgi:2-iminobutanoate/2-iminopropanoate deaminase